MKAKLGMALCVFSLLAALYTYGVAFPLFVIAILGIVLGIWLTLQGRARS